MNPETAFIVLSIALSSIHPVFYQLGDVAFKTPKYKFHGKGKFPLLFMALQLFLILYPQKSSFTQVIRKAFTMLFIIMLTTYLIIFYCLESPRCNFSCIIMMLFFHISNGDLFDISCITFTVNHFFGGRTITNRQVFALCPTLIK